MDSLVDFQNWFGRFFIPTQFPRATSTGVITRPTRLLFALACLIGTATAALQSATADSPVEDSKVSVVWELKSNFTDIENGFEARFVLTNNGNETLTDRGWGMYFNMAPRPIVDHPASQPAKVHHINGDWYRLLPETGFQLSPGQSIEIRYMGTEAVIKESDAPLGLYFIFQPEDSDQTRIQRVTQYRIAPLTQPTQINRGPTDSQPIPTAQQRYNDNRTLRKLPESELPPVVPTPVKCQTLTGTARFDSNWTILYADGIDALASYVASELNSRMGFENESLPDSSVSNANEHVLSLRIQPVDTIGSGREAYTLTVSDRRIELIGSDQDGLFYAIQSLLNLFPVEAYSKRSADAEIPCLVIHDSPRFGYRGLHIDVSRNFQSKETLERIIDVMAMYKLNRLLLYTTEDEGWRIEIPGLPELTSVGGQRAHNSGMHHPSLHPAYGSGPEAYAPDSHGSGFYTRDEFIELLKYSAQRRVKIIPEVNFPGHARAAIKAMEARYHRLVAEGNIEAAEEYRLIDPDDTSTYLSAQAYKDNVVSVARPSTYRFYNKVLDELAAMYEQAGLVMDEIHTGGDEVPEGAWTASPMASRLLAEQPEIGGAENLQTYFFRRLLTELDKRGLRALGWEEVFQRKDEQGRAEPNPEFVGRNVVAYIWNNLFDYDLGNRLANIGYPVILCNVSNFYFDLAYDKDPEEPGLYWAGFVNEKDAFLFAPYNYMWTTFRTSMGQPIDIDRVQSETIRLQPEAYGNIRGVQAQLWSETIKGRQMIEYYMLPKLIGFSESAWAAERSWESMEDRSSRERAMDQAWNVMANCIGQRELTRLAYFRKGYHFRIAPPGGIIQDGTLKANTSFPGLTLRYTLDGSEPQIHSPIYTQPIAASRQVQLRAFDSSGRGSRVVRVSE